MKTERKLKIYIILGMAVIAASEYTSHVYDLKTNFITSYESAEEAPSPLACLSKCSRRPDCHYCAYNSTTGSCFLHVLFDSTKAVKVKDVTVFADNLGSKCEHSEAVNYAETKVSWERSGVQGNLTCRDDYLYSGDLPVVSCSSSGLWTADGTCRQRIWRNTGSSMARFILPRPSKVGWAMCVRGTACQSCPKLTFNLVQLANLMCHVDARFKYGSYVRRVIVDRHINRVWGPSRDLSNFPFTQGQPYAIQFRLVTLTTLEITVDESLLLNYTLPNAFAVATQLHVFPVSENPLHFVDVAAGCQ